MATIDVPCRRCNQTKAVVRNGKAPNGTQRYYCQSCKCSFRLDYRYNGSKQGIAKQVVDMAMNGSGVRDTARVLGLSVTTVIKHLKNSRHPQ